jgi:hypothetical protein
VERALKQKVGIAIAISLIGIVFLSLFLLFNWGSSNQTPDREFFVGVEYAYGNQSREVIALVDKVKDYTNLFVIGAEMTSDNLDLTNACDYVYAANLSFIVQFKGLDRYDYNITTWLLEATQKYGDQFLGVYRYDEPGGRQLDATPDLQLINSTVIGPDASYGQVSTAYVGNLSYFPAYYLQFAPKMFTADYALYWFDYKANYTTLFGEFVGNESRHRHIALCRGAAEAFNKDWGTIITWKYFDEPPYLEGGEELYDDLALSYSAGAKYAVVFSYPQIGEYGTLTDDHFDALQRFWNTLHSNPSSFGTNNAKVAYVVPADYGFGFRRPDDSIWGLFPADNLSPKIYNDVLILTERYGAHLDIFYDEPIVVPLLANYQEVFYWNQTIS